MAAVPQRAFAIPPDATQVILARHGASAPAVPGEPFATDSYGHGDPVLAPEGERQAEALAARLADEPATALFVTTLRRTVQTAAPLAELTGLEPVVVPELREVYLGEWEAGEWRIRLATGDPLALRVVAEERWDLVPGGEDPPAFAARVRAGIDRIVEAVGPGGTAIAVVHGGVIGEICRQASDSRPFAFVHSDNASITRVVVFADGRWLLRTFNDTAHLAGVEALA